MFLVSEQQNMGKRRPGVSEDLMSNTAEEWKTMLAAPEVLSVKHEQVSPLPPKKFFNFQCRIFLSRWCSFRYFAGSSWPFGLWCLLRMGRTLSYHETHNHKTQSQGDLDMLRILILGLPFSINVIKLDQLAMQRGKDLVQVSLVKRGNRKRLTKLKFQHLIFWC